MRRRRRRPTPPSMLSREDLILSAEVGAVVARLVRSSGAGPGSVSEAVRKAIDSPSCPLRDDDREIVRAWLRDCHARRL